ncbi:MAG: group I truncated hemoglobin [Ignavibacteria bacterium]
MIKQFFFSFVLVMLISGKIFSQEKTLYQRLGGYDAIAAVVDDFVMHLSSDAELGVFFKGHSEDSQKKIRQHVIDFICNAAGGPCVYVGRDMKTSHKGLGITEAQWNKSVNYLKETLNKFKVPEKEQNELFAAVSSVKNDIVEKM